MTIPATLFDFFHRTNRATPVTIISHLQVYGCVSSFSDSRPAPHRGLFFAQKKESVEKSDPFIIPPDDLARLRRLEGRRATLCSVKHFGTIGDYKARGADVRCRVLATYRYRVLNADRVIQVDHRLDTGKTSVTQNPLAQIEGALAVVYGAAAIKLLSRN